MSFRRWYRSGFAFKGRALAVAVCAAIGVPAEPAASAPETPSRVLLSALEIGEGASGLDDLGRRLLAGAAKKELAQATGACVIDTAELSKLLAAPSAEARVCGVAAEQAVFAPWLVIPELHKAEGTWALWLEVIDVPSARVIAKARAGGSDVSGVIAQLPDVLDALVAAALAYPRATSRVLGVLAAEAEAGCRPGIERPVDAEGVAEWGAPVAWYVERYGLERVERSARDVGLESAVLAAERAALASALAWLLADLSLADREIIHARSEAFEAWSKREVLAGPPAAWIASRQVLEQRVDDEGRAARVLVRACIDTHALRVATVRRLQLLDPKLAPAVVVIAADRALAQSAVRLVERFAFPKPAIDVAAPLPSATAAGAQAVRRSLQANDAACALLVDAEVQASRDGPQVHLRLRATDREGADAREATTVVTPLGATAEDAPERAMTGLRDRLPPELEEVLLRLKRC